MIAAEPVWEFIVQLTIMFAAGGFVALIACGWRPFRGWGPK